MEGVTIMLWNTMEESAEVSHWLLFIGFTQNIVLARGLELYNKGSSLISKLLWKKFNGIAITYLCI